MIRVLVGLMLASSVLGLFVARAQSGPPRELAKFPATALKWILIAEPEFEREKLDVDKYTLTVIEDADSVTVMLIGTDNPPGARGSSSRYPGYEVEIRKKDHKMISAHYIR